MILGRGTVPSVPVMGSAPRHEAHVSDLGGITRFGAHLVILHPGEKSSDRHWHANEDEFLYMLSGQGVVVEDDGEHPVSPGDIACWPAGVANAHHVVNRSDAPLTYLIVGDRCGTTDTVRYPDSGRTLYHQPPRWQLVADDGTVLNEGDT